MSARLLTWEEAVQWLKDQHDKQDIVRHCYYDDPLEYAAERFSNSEEWQVIKHLLRKHLPGKILDLGAGRGISSYAFAKAGCLVTALEPDPSSLVGTQAIHSLFSRTELPVEVIQEYGETLPFPTGAFDVVYGRAILHHACNLTKLCQEAARVLRPGGVLLATREHVLSKKADLQLFLDSHPLHHLYGGENAYLLQEYIEAIRTAGLQLKKASGPFESEINYAPMTRQEFQAKVTSVMARCLDIRLASRLSTVRTVQQFFGWYISQRSDTPGRHYSFLAIKK